VKVPVALPVFGGRRWAARRGERERLQRAGSAAGRAGPRPPGWELSEMAERAALVSSLASVRDVFFDRRFLR